MDKFIDWFFATFPLVKSPQFWGIVGLAAFTLAKAKGWIDEDWATFLQMVTGLPTGVGLANKVATKISSKKAE